MADNNNDILDALVDALSKKITERVNNSNDDDSAHNKKDIFSEYENSFKTAIDRITDGATLNGDGRIHAASKNIKNGGKGIFGDEVSNKKEEIKLRNELLGKYKEEEEAFSRISEARKQSEIDLNNIRAVNNDFSATEEAKLQADILKKYKTMFEDTSDDDKETYAKADAAEAEIYKKALLEGRKTLNDDELKRLKEIEQDRLGSQENIAKREKERLETIDNKWKKVSDAITNTFKTVLTHLAQLATDVYFFDRVKEGSKGFTSEYEKNFTPIAGYTGSDSREDTHNLITDTLSQIRSNEALDKGLNFNEDVFPEITKAVKNGFLGDEAQDVAITNAIDQKIMPWLETSSDTWVQLQYNLTDERLQQIKGQQLLLQETREGNRILQTGVVGTLLDSLQPTLLNIDANTTNFEDLSAQTQGVAAYLMDSGYSKQDAIKVSQQMIDAYQNPYAAATSNSPIEILMGTSQLAGGDFSDLIEVYASVGGMGVGTGAAGMGAIQEAMGVNYGGYTRDDNNAKDLANMSEDVNDYIEAFTIDPEKANRKYLDNVNNLPEDVTATSEFDNKSENKWAATSADANLFAHAADLNQKLLDEVIIIKDNVIKLAIGYGVAKVLEPLLNKVGDKIGKKVLGKFLGKGATEAGEEVVENVAKKTLLTKGATGLANAATHLPGVTAGANGIAATGSLSTTLGSIGGGSTVAGGAAVAAPLIVGGVAAYEGIKGGIEDFKEGENQNIGRGIASTAGGVAAGVGGAAVAGGMLAAGTANAWNPVGWGLLLAGGITVAVTAIDRYTSKLETASENVDILSDDFENLRQSVVSTNIEKGKEIKKIQESFYNLDTEREKRQLLVDEGLVTNTEALKMNTAELEGFLTGLQTANEEDMEDAEELVAGLENKYSAESKDEIKSVLDQIYGSLKGKSEDEQREMLESLGVNDKTIDLLMKNKKDGAASDGELWRAFTDEDGKLAGEEFESITEQIESGAISTTDMNRYMSKYTDSESRVTSEKKYMDHLNEIVPAVLYLGKYKEYGRPNDKATFEPDDPEAVGFDQAQYDEYKQTLLNIPEAHKHKVKDAFMEQFGEDVDPSKLEGYKLGSTFIPEDQIAILHKGERVLTEGQNKDYTRVLTESQNLQVPNLDSIQQAQLTTLMSAGYSQTEALKTMFESQNSEIDTDVIKSLGTKYEKTNKPSVDDFESLIDTYKLGTIYEGFGKPSSDNFSSLSDLIDGLNNNKAVTKDKLEGFIDNPLGTHHTLSKDIANYQEIYKYLDDKNELDKYQDIYEGLVNKSDMESNVNVNPLGPPTDHLTQIKEGIKYDDSLEQSFKNEENSIININTATISINSLNQQSESISPDTLLTNSIEPVKESFITSLGKAIANPFETISNFKDLKAANRVGLLNDDMVSLQSATNGGLQSIPGFEWFMPKNESFNKSFMELIKSKSMPDLRATFEPITEYATPAELFNNSQKHTISILDSFNNHLPFINDNQPGFNNSSDFIQELQPSNSSTIQAGVTDIVTAIRQQTLDIINYLREASVSNAGSFQKLNMSPAMSNTRVTW